MEKITISAPAMYGDHHVVEVRRILLETPGVEDVYASSCFQAVEVTFDPTRVSIDEINGMECATYTLGSDDVMTISEDDVLVDNNGSTGLTDFVGTMSADGMKRLGTRNGVLFRNLLPR